jgi:hypothetical protein
LLIFCFLPSSISFKILSTSSKILGYQILKFYYTECFGDSAVDATYGNTPSLTQDA